MSTHKMTLTWTIEDRQNSYLVSSDTEVLVGRRLECDIILPDPSVSREHAKIYFANGRFHICNLSQVNPVRVQSSSDDAEPQSLAPDQHVPIDEGAQLCVGPVQLKVVSIEITKTPQRKKCAHCGQLVEANAKNCPWCGRALPMGQNIYVE